ncbi:MAG: SRPBCC family protein [Actinobacteria bacterium]|nr:SRPBCC family protein [Actinomycetota bacterium]
MSESEKLRVTRTVDVAPAQIFAVLADPDAHTDMDGSTQLRGLAEGSTLTGVGDEFVMNMHNGILGDYQVRNVVVSYEENRTIGWAPHLHPEGAYADKLGGMKAGGHTFTWELQPAESGGTTITQVYDWSGVPDPAFKGLFPMINEAALGESLDKVAARAKG